MEYLDDLATARNSSAPLNGQTRLFHADDILTHEATAAIANAIGLVMETRHDSPDDVPDALYNAARSLAAIKYKGNEIVRKLSDPSVVGDMPRSVAISIINEGIAEGRKQPISYAIDGEAVDAVAPQCDGEPEPSRNNDWSREVACAVAQAGSPEEKLAALESEALRLSVPVAAGVLDRSVAADALYDPANSNGLLERFGADTVQHLCANGLDGRTSRFKPAAPQPIIPVGVDGANGSSLIYRCAADIVPEAIQWLWQVSVSNRGRRGDHNGRRVAVR